MCLSPDYIMDGEDIKSANVLSESQHGECQIVHYENVSFHHNLENDPEEKQHSQIVDVEVHVPNILRKKSLNMYETVPIESHPIRQHRSVDVSPIQPEISYGACLNESEVYSTPVPVPDYTLESNATKEYDLVHSKLSVDNSLFIPQQIDESFSSPLADSFAQDFVVDDKVEILNSNQESEVIDDNLLQATVPTIIKNIDSTAISSELTSTAITSEEVYSVPETELMDKSEEIIITKKLEEPEVTLDGSFPQPQETEENIDPTFVSASHEPETISTSGAISVIQGISFIEPESFVDIPSQKTKENIDHIDDTVAPKYNLKPESVVENKSEAFTVAKESNEEEPEVTFDNSSKPTPHDLTSVSASHELEIISVAQKAILLEAESYDDIFSQSTSQETKERIDHIALFAPKYIPKVELNITPSAISVTQEINVIEPETTVDISSQPRSQKTEEKIDHTIAVFAPKYNLKPEFCVENKSEAFTVAKESNEEEPGVAFCSPSQLTSQETDKTLDPASISASHEPEILFTPEVTTLTDLESVTVFQNLNPLESVPQPALQQNEASNNFNQVASLFEQDTRSAPESDVEGKSEAIAVVHETQSKDLEVNIDCSSQPSQETEENVPKSALYEPEITAAPEVIFVTEGTTTALYEPEITAAPEAISVTEGTATALFEPEITFTQESEPKEKSETVSFANENIDNVEITDTSFQPTSNDYESISASYEPETYTKPELISDTQVNHHIGDEFSVDVLTLSTTIQAEGNIDFTPVTTSFESKLNFKPDETPEITSKKEESEDAFFKPASVSFEPESNVIPTNISEVITQQSNVNKVENLDISSEVPHTIIG